jgi:hypothetical protein
MSPVLNFAQSDKNVQNTDKSHLRRLVWYGCHCVHFHETHSYLTNLRKGSCKGKQTRMTRGGRGIALLFLDLGARRGWVASTTSWPLYHRERPGTHCIGGWVSPRAGMGVCEKSRPHRDFFLLHRTPDSPALSQSLYRLSYPGPKDILYRI